MTFSASRGFSRPQEHRHGLSRRRLVNVYRYEAVAAVMGVEERQLLAAVGPVLGVVGDRHQLARRLIEVVAEQREHRRHHPRERDRARQIFQPSLGRLRAQIAPGFLQPPHRHLEGRVLSQRAEIVGVRITRRNRQRQKPDHLGQPVNDPIRRTRVLRHRAKPIGKAAAVETHYNRLAANR